MDFEHTYRANKKGSSQCKPLTDVEKKWIEQLNKLAEKMPKKLWLFAAAGEACIMKTPDNGNEMNADHSVNQDNLVGYVRNLRCDGGDW